MADWLNSIRDAKKDAEETVATKKEIQKRKEEDTGRPPNESIEEVRHLIKPLFEEVKRAIASTRDEYPKISDKSYIIPKEKRRGSDPLYAYYTIDFELSRLPLKMNLNPVLTVHADIDAYGWRAIRASAKVVTLPTELATKFDTADGATVGTVINGLKNVIGQFMKNYYDLVKQRSI